MKFWIVWSPGGTTPPRVKHSTREEAIVAAESMANQHPSQTFYVMEAMSISRTVRVETEVLK